ncbi:TonB-dependent receptor [uncultured Novosphingobium sp.]|uniref:TonB-dependent receptor n=1 Tax=uncultured Novosphingobium sp. TaxID=292277 RepID=UPI00374A91D8
MVCLSAFVLIASISGAQAQTQNNVPDVEDGEADSGANDIVVTALRRAANIQDIPISVTAISAVAIDQAGIADSSLIGQATPALNMAKVGINVIPTIRGIGTNNAALGDDANVAVYVDGVYKPSAVGNNFALAGIEQIQVLKGPQGTLFGRNAEGGAILITTRTPSFTQVESQGSVAYGERNTLEAKGYLSVPFSPTAALSLSGMYRRADGYNHDDYLDQDIGAIRDVVVRPKLALALSDTLTATALFQYAHTSDASGVAYAPILAGGSRPAYTGLPAGANLPVPTKPRHTALSFVPVNRVATYDGSFKLAYEGDNVSLSSQTSMTRVHNMSHLDSDQGPLNLAASRIRSRERTYQQEFLLSAPRGASIQWVAGLFLYSAKASYAPRTGESSANGVTPLSVTTFYADLKSKSAAPFGEVTVPIGERLKVTGGARYTWERRSIEGYQISPANVVTTNTGQSRLFKSFTPRAIIAYEFPDVVNIYASYSRGFKSGTYNSTNLTQPEADPEKLTAYELGVKTLSHGPWRASAAVFYQDYKAIQLSAFNTTGFNVVLFNAATGRSYGAEAEVHGKIVDGLTLDAFASYTNARYDDFRSAVVNVPKANGAAGLQTRTNVDVSGERFIRVPKWTAGATIGYAQPLAGGVLTSSANIYYRSSMAWDLSYINKAQGYALVNGDIAWSPEGSRWSFGVFARNLLNKNYQTGGNSNANTYYTVWGEPRVIGGRVTLALGR